VDTNFVVDGPIGALPALARTPGIYTRMLYVLAIASHAMKASTAAKKSFFIEVPAIH
jgi:hypothetical protein